MEHLECLEKRLAVLTAIGAAGLAAVCGVSGFLMAEAMNRREPKLSREVAQTLRKNAIPPQYGTGVYEAQERLRNAPHETVTTTLVPLRRAEADHPRCAWLAILLVA